MNTLINILSSHPSLKYGALLLAYMGLVRHLRYRRINALLRKYPDPTIPLRNLSIAYEVAANVSELDFPYINVVSLEFALFKTYAIPSISKILAATKQFTSNCLRRTDDTVLILLEMNEGHARNVRRTMLEGGKVDEEEVANDERRKEIATERLNFLHGHYNIKQGDYLYTLAMFILEPAVFIDKFEWRETTLLEKNVRDLAHFLSTFDQPSVVCFCVPVFCSTLGASALVRTRTEETRAREEGERGDPDNTAHLHDFLKMFLLLPLLLFFLPISFLSFL